MNNDVLKELEEKLGVLEFKLEIVLKLTKVEIGLTLNECKSMIELAFIMNLNKDQFNKINELISNQVVFFNSCNSKSYMNSRQLTKLDSNIDVFKALSKEEYENGIWTIVPKLEANHEVCEKIAKLSGISDIYYGDFASEIRIEKIKRLDKKEKLLGLYKEYKGIIDDLYLEFDIMRSELKTNLVSINNTIEFFKENRLQKISLFYNSELWERAEDDKIVVLNENSSIHQVCTTVKFGILDTIIDNLKQKNIIYNELLVHLLNCGPVSSQNIENLKLFYQTMNQFNQNDFIILNDLINFKQTLLSKIAIADEIINSYYNYVNNLDKC